MTMQPNATFQDEYGAIFDFIEDLSFSDFCNARNGGMSLSDVLYAFSILEDKENDKDGLYKLSSRAMLFPFSFSLQYKNHFAGQACALCGRKIVGDLTIDHINPLATIFNSMSLSEVRTKEQRRKIFFDLSNLQAAHKKCNCQKGADGETYDQAKMNRCEF